MKSDRTPIYLSAFVYPGAGQFLQGRWLAGIFYSILFTIFLCIFIANVARPIFANINTALSFAEGGRNESFSPVSLPGLLIPFGVSLAFYIGSIVDAVRATRRAHSIKPPPLPEV